MTLHTQGKNNLDWNHLKSFILRLWMFQQQWI